MSKFSVEQLLRIDLVGAVLSAIMLGIVLPMFIDAVGPPLYALIFLSSFPIAFTIADLIALLSKPVHRPIYLVRISVLNAVYCAISLAMVFSHWEDLTPLGFMYFFGELMIVGFLAWVEWSKGSHVLALSKERSTPAIGNRAFLGSILLMGFLLSFGLRFLYSTSTPPVSSRVDIDVHWAGALRQMMHQGNIAPQAHIKELENTPHVYALGALAELKGEVLIWDGEPLMAQAVEGQVAVRQSFEHKATLLVYTAVAEWHEVAVPDSVKSYDQLEVFVESAAMQQGIDTENPFPFLVQGRVARANWHVIDWPEGDTVHSHQKHVTSGPHGRLENEELDVLGFYSKHHHAVFTHHSTNMHLHGKTPDNAWAAHIDDLELGSNALLKLPVH